jgi:hypothetical protein
MLQQVNLADAVDQLTDLMPLLERTIRDLRQAQDF